MNLRIYFNYVKVQNITLENTSKSPELKMPLKVLKVKVLNAVKPPLLLLKHEMGLIWNYFVGLQLMIIFSINRSIATPLQSRTFSHL